MLAHQYIRKAQVVKDLSVPANRGNPERWPWLPGCLKESDPKQRRPLLARQPSATPRATDAAGGEAILCRSCRNIVTQPIQRMIMLGSHDHTFANPAGLVYEIGLFRIAAGCAATGIPSAEFTWFKGYRWRVAICRSCGVHLGWHFGASSGDGFWGLILDRLIQTRQGDG